MPRLEEKLFKGWGPFTFGMKFDDVLTAYPGVVWDAESLRKCRDEMPLKGCTLNPTRGSRVSSTFGLALRPTVIFNQEGKLAAIRLWKFLRGDIKPAQCERAYSQLLKYLHETWGPPTASASNEHATLKMSTLKGSEFLPETGDGAVVRRETFHVQPDGRQIILRSSYIGATESAPAVCHLSIHYRGHESLQPPEERPDRIKNWY